MKKALSVILAIMMIFTIATPAFAVENKTGSDYPILFLRGNSEDIADADGNIVYDFSYDPSNLPQEIIDLCTPLVTKGLTTGDFSDYYNAVYENIAKLYGNAKCDENGDPMAGTDSAHVNLNGESLKSMPKNGPYEFKTCEYFNDWRIDPWEGAERLRTFIEEIREATGKDKVSIYGKCLGGTPIVAYLARYGGEYIDTICLDSTVANGSEMIGDMFTAKLNIDTEAVIRMANGYKREPLASDLGGELVFDLIYQTVRILHSVGVMDSALDLLMDNVISPLCEGVVGAFVRGSYATWPAYWSMVKTEDLERAKEVVFGPEGSADREKFAGLIEKIDRLHEKVCSRIPEILQNAKAEGVKFCIVAKYGSQMFPYVESYDKLSDQWVSVENASIGATACKIGKTLPKSYIEQQEEAGLGKYISADKQVDASTCALPENTWIIKGLNHEQWKTSNEELAYAVCSNVIKDNTSDPDYPQFLCYDKENEKLVPLTTENMNCEDYYGTDTGSTDNLTKHEKIKKRLFILFDLFLSLFRLLKNAISNKNK